MEHSTVTLLTNMTTVAYDILFTPPEPIDADTVARLEAFGDDKISQLLMAIWRPTQATNGLKAYMHTMSLQCKVDPESGTPVLHLMGQVCFDSQDWTTCLMLNVHLKSVAAQTFCQLISG